jgi:hypothetical protein
MTDWLKTVGCECDECGTTACATDACLCSLDLNTSGGDAGYDHTFDTTGDFTSTRDIYPDFQSYTVKDQLLIYANGVLVYDSGCIGAHVTPTVSIASGTTSVRVQVVPNCEGTVGTAWLLSITCAAP